MKSQMKMYMGHGLEGPSAGAFVPVELGFVPILVRGCVHPPGSSPNPILVDSSSHRHDQLLSLFQPPLLSREVKGEAENFRLLIMAWLC